MSTLYKEIKHERKVASWDDKSDQKPNVAVKSEETSTHSTAVPNSGEINGMTSLVDIETKWLICKNNLSSC